MLNAQNAFFTFSFFTYKQKCHSNEPKQRHSLAAMFYAVWRGGYLQAARTETQLAAAGVSKLRSLLTQRNKGVMIHDQQHAKVKQENGTK
jgi:hypothetical protein